jgi:exosortase E/protease (VPEID-CTERM system)
MGLIAFFLSLYLWVDRERLRFPRALVVLPLGVVAMYLGNLARIVLLVLLGARISPAIATGGFHSKAGWVYFCGLTVLLMLYLSRSEFFRREQVADATPKETAVQTLDMANPVAVFLVPALTLLAAALITGMFNEGRFDPFYGVRILAVSLVVFHYRATIGKLLGGMSPYGVISGIVCFGLWMWLAPAPSDIQNRASLDAFHQLPTTGRWLWLATRVGGAVLVVPLAEELAFRGFLLRRFVSADFEAVPPGQVTWLGLLGSSLVFGLLHSAIAAGATVGAVYALTMWRKGSIADAILAHSVTNALLCAYVLWSGQWGYW